MIIIESYIVLGLLFFLIQAIKKKKIDQSLVLTLLFPFYGYPKFHSKTKGLKSFFFNMAFVNLIYIIILFFLDINYSDGIYGEHSSRTMGSSGGHSLIGAMFSAPGLVFTGAYYIIKLIIYCVVFVLGIILPMIMALISKNKTK